MDGPMRLVLSVRPVRLAPCGWHRAAGIELVKTRTTSSPPVAEALKAFESSAWDATFEIHGRVSNR